MKSIATYAPAFLAYNNSVLARLLQNVLFKMISIKFQPWPEMFDVMCQKKYVQQSGLLSTLLWIFKWPVPKVKNPQPWDVALNNYLAYAVSETQQPVKAYTK